MNWEEFGEKWLWPTRVMTPTLASKKTGETHERPRLE
jgi:hypothetical protein